MEWPSLLSTQRLGRDEFDNTSESRSPFQIDYDRIVFSSAFRRMQRKAQVNPLPNNDFTHTRLTHSIEVASVGRSLGQLVGEEVVKDGIINDQGYKVTASDFGNIVAAGCLAHDIGNPPFGHAGEEAFSHWFLSHKEYLSGVEKKNQSDLLEFEGNAQGFRILTRLQLYPRKGGMQLTAATLGAFCKYPRLSSVPKDKRIGISGKKFSCFHSESVLLEELGEILKLERKHSDQYYWCRHPFTFLVEAADDICYNLIDLEDAYRLKKISFMDAENMLVSLLGPRGIGKSYETLEEKNKIVYLRSKAIGELIQQCVDVFLANQSNILSGRFETPLLKETVSHKAVKEISDTTTKLFFKDREILEIELAGFDIVAGLLSAFIPALLQYKADKPDRKSNKIIGILESTGPIESKDDYYLIQRATDYVSGMTDDYALSLFKKTTGVSL